MRQAFVVDFSISRVNSDGTRADRLREQRTVTRALTLQIKENSGSMIDIASEPCALSLSLKPQPRANLRELLDHPTEKFCLCRCFEASVCKQHESPARQAKKALIYANWIRKSGLKTSCWLTPMGSVRFLIPKLLHRFQIICAVQNRLPPRSRRVAFYIVGWIRFFEGSTISNRFEESFFRIGNQHVYMRRGVALVWTTRWLAARGSKQKQPD